MLKTLQWIVGVATGGAVLSLMVALIATISELPVLDGGGVVFFLAAAGTDAFALSRVCMVIAAIGLVPLAVIYFSQPAPSGKPVDPVHGTGERINPDEIVDRFKSHW